MGWTARARRPVRRCAAMSRERDCGSFAAQLMCASVPWAHPCPPLQLAPEAGYLHASVTARGHSGCRFLRRPALVTQGRHSPPKRCTRFPAVGTSPVCASSSFSTAPRCRFMAPACRTAARQT